MNILETIVSEKKREISRLPEGAVASDRLRETLARRGGVRDFVGALRRPRLGDIGLIAEVKKASPSAGVIRGDFNPVAIAQAYERSGASCLSVLTDEKFFQGSLAYLRDIRAAVELPLLRKDFIIDERQIEEAVEWGADAVLLIVAILTDAELARFHRLAAEAGLAVLVETHDLAELDRALAINATLIGVNNRDLKTFKVSLETTERLAGALARRTVAGEEVLLVSESGIHGREDVERCRRCGAAAVLVGESLMRAGDIREAMRAILGIASPGVGGNR